MSDKVENKYPPSSLRTLLMWLFIGGFFIGSIFAGIYFFTEYHTVLMKAISFLFLSSGLMYFSLWLVVIFKERVKK